MHSTHTILEFCKQEIDKQKALSSPYLTEIVNGNMSKDQFTHSQIQFFFAVAFFSRPMSALMARFSDPNLRLKILENILEEHGNFNSSAFHESTFKQFLKSLGVTSEEISKITPGSEVRAFNAALISTCTFDNTDIAVSCMGAIELMFAQISSIIGHATVKNNWVAKEQLIHYTLHEKIDLEHANDFFQLAEHNWINANTRANIIIGIDLGIYIFKRLYDDLYLVSQKT